MPCENLQWGYWNSGNFKGKQYHKINANPNGNRAKLIIGGEWKYDRKTGEKSCRPWTKEEINSGYGNTKNGKVKLVPINCGDCDQCRLNRANEWVTRILCEYKTSGRKGCKIDLTYNAKNVPKGYVLSKADYQGWIKRLRTHLSRNDKNFKGFKYYIGGEYGPEKGRPHYHIILIGWEPEDIKFWKYSKTGYEMYRSKLIEKTWNKGFCTIEPLTAETVSYATRYTNKKSGKAKTNKGIPEFQQQSQGIGLNYWIQNKDEIINDTGIWIKKQDKAKLVKIPRYFRKKWQEENPVQHELFIDWKTQRQEQQQKEIMQNTDKPIIDYLKDQVETSKIIYDMLKRQNLDTDEQRQANNDNIKELLKKRLTG